LPERPPADDADFEKGRKPQLSEGRGRPDRPPR
jgi:hypothetical protein